MALDWRGLADPPILLFCCIGAYSLQNSGFHVMQVAFFGDATVFVTQPISLRLLLAGALLLVAMILPTFRKAREQALQEFRIVPGAGPCTHLATALGRGA